MDKDYIWQGDYGNRDYLRPVLKQLLREQMASSLQCILLAVNNNPYNLEFFLMVSYNIPKEHDVQTMRSLFEAAGLRRRTDLSFTHLMCQGGNRRFNYQALSDEESVDSLYDSNLLFFWPERSTLEKKGYRMVPLGKQSRVFISHSSIDKPEVEELLPFLNAANLPVWFDKYDMQVGDSIVESVQAGIENSNNVIFWITKNFLGSNWCKHEMNAFIRKLIEENICVISVLAPDISAGDLPLFLRDIKFIQPREAPVEAIAAEIVALYRDNHTGLRR